MSRANDRLDELKTKTIGKGGYFSLSAEERKEYQALKKQLEEEKEGKPIEMSVKPIKEDQEVSLTKSELEKMVNEAAGAAVKNLKAENEQLKQKVFGQWEEREDADVGNKQATLKVYRKDAKSKPGLVVRQDYLKTVWDEMSHKYDKIIYEIEILYADDTTETAEVDAVQYARMNETEYVELIKNERKALRKVDGTVSIPPKDKDGYSIRNANMEGYGEIPVRGPAGEVDLEVVKYQEIFTAKRKNGQEFKINAIYLNS